MIRMIKKVMKYLPESSNDYKKIEVLALFLTDTLQSMNNRYICLFKQRNKTKREKEYN